MQVRPKLFTTLSQIGRYYSSTSPDGARGLSHERTRRHGLQEL